jgi:Tol biopolymer transport system component
MNRTPSLHATAAAMAITVAMAAAACSSKTGSTPAAVRSSSGAASPSVLPSPTAQSPGGVIVFGRGPHDGHFELFTINADGTNERELLAHPNLIVPPQLSPDGTRVASVGPSPNNAKADAAIIVDVSTGSVRVLEMPDPTLFPVCVVWSSDGSRLACGLSGHGRSGISTIRSSDGGGLTRVTSNPGGQDLPLVYSPDGSKLLFLRGPHMEGEPNQLFVVGADGGAAHRLNPSGTTADFPFLGLELSSATWSPDGKQVTFAAASGSGERSAVFVVNADGSDRHRITPWASAFLAQWSPDGQWIAYSGRRPGEEGGTSVFIVHPDGTGLRAVAPSAGGPFFFGAVWSPDSTKLLFTRLSGGALPAGEEEEHDQTDLWTVNVDGTDLTQLTHTPGRYAGYGWALG